MSEAKWLEENSIILSITERGVCAGLANKLRNALEEEVLRVEIYNELSAERIVEDD